MPIITDRWSKEENHRVHLANVDVVSLRHVKEKNSGTMISPEDINRMWRCVLSRMVLDGELKNFNEEEIEMLTLLVLATDLQTEEKIAEMRSFSKKNIDQMEEYYGFKSTGVTAQEALKKYVNNSKSNTSGDSFKNVKKEETKPKQKETTENSLILLLFIFLVIFAITFIIS